MCGFATEILHIVEEGSENEGILFSMKNFGFEFFRNWNFGAKIKNWNFFENLNFAPKLLNSKLFEIDILAPE